jgi:hypothetical protein
VAIGAFARDLPSAHVCSRRILTRWSGGDALGTTAVKLAPMPNLHIRPEASRGSSAMSADIRWQQRFSDHRLALPPPRGTEPCLMPA